MLLSDSERVLLVADNYTLQSKINLLGFSGVINLACRTIQRRGEIRRPWTPVGPVTAAHVFDLLPPRPNRRDEELRILGTLGSKYKREGLQPHLYWPEGVENDPTTALHAEISRFVSVQVRSADTLILLTRTLKGCPHLLDLLVGFSDRQTRSFAVVEHEDYDGSVEAIRAENAGRKTPAKVYLLDLLAIFCNYGQIIPAPSGPQAAVAA